MKLRIDNNDLSLDEYEGIFDGELEEVKDDFESKWARAKQEKWRFWIGLILGFILGFIVNLSYDLIKSLLT